jgi:hypothetical protein
MVSGGIKFVIALVVILFVAAAGWIVFTNLRARRLGLPTPTLSSYFSNPFKNDSSSYREPSAAPGGIVGWVNDKIRAFKNRNSRVAGGAYEEPLTSTRGRGANRGFGPLDPDDAWDARVGNETDAYGPGGYYEEQELGLHSNADIGYGGSGANTNLAPAPGQAPSGFADDRGRSRSREPEPYIGGSQAGLDRRYDEEMGRKPAGTTANPFGDDAEASNVSLRGVSPRPIDTSLGAKGHSNQDSGDSPTERRSMFRENM